MNKNIIMVILIILVGGGSFFGGMKYQQGKTSQNIRSQFGAGQVQRGTGAVNISGQPRPVGNRMTGRGVTGEILSQDEKSITVKLTDGSSKIVFLAETTTINKASEGTKTDLTTGEQVMVFGTENSDGSLTASNIQLNPINLNIGNRPENETLPTGGTHN